jgi:uncharacterized membrane protein
MRFLYLLSVLFHILAAGLWVGGMVFLAIVLVPVIRRPEHQDMGASLIYWAGTRFRVLAWACLGVLLVTGALNVTYRGVKWADVASEHLLRGTFGGMLGGKLAILTMIVLLSAVHDFWIGPRATGLRQANPGSLEAARFRCVASWLGRLNLLLGLVAVGVGVMLVRGWP